MNAHCRYYPAPRPSLKTERSPKPSYVYCSCPTPCGRESCTGPEQARGFTNYPDGSTAPFPPQPPSPHVHFLGLYQTYLVDYDYDRSSTIVMPNECALPARGCPGKTYFSTQVANVARTGRRLGRCATPAGSRGNSRSRMNMSPPPSPSLCARHILYPDEYPFPSPNPSPRAMAAPPLVPDTGFTPQSSDDSDQGLSTPPETASQTPTPPSLSRRSAGYPSHMGSPLFIDAPGHPPIPGYISPTTRSTRDMFAITNALNGVELSNGGSGASPVDGPWKIPGRRAAASHSPTEGGITPKKLKSKKSKSSLPSIPGEANAASAAKRAHIVSPACTSWRSDTGALGGF